MGNKKKQNAMSECILLEVPLNKGGSRGLLSIEWYNIYLQVF